ncbi:MAG TPA: hypothetical protein VFK94_02320 [Patescibacteria group bacterium]|nr:hypothetical protein [Patescibacteria group bacterium]
MANSVKTEDVDFYNPHATLKRDPGVYLDEVERVKAEEQRAVREDRDPDFDNLPAATGTPLVTRSELPHVPVGTAPESFTTLAVATETGDDDAEKVEKLRSESAKVRDKEIVSARVEQIKREGEAAAAAVKDRERRELASVEDVTAGPSAASKSDTNTGDSPDANSRSENTAKKATAKKATAKKATSSSR